MDTSAAAAVTLKHQFARQTAGRVTLEFRFRLTQRMDGACWQLRNPQSAGVGLVTRGPNLAWEAGQVLMSYAVDRDYGVKVAADITTQKADVFVDGDALAKGLPFVHPVKSLDYLLVKTGDAATGEMFLNPVNIHACGTPEQDDSALAGLPRAASAL